MGLFTYVEIAKELLPEEFRKFENWQTKQVVTPSLNTLIIKNDGSLIYNDHILDYHGDMEIHQWDNEKKIMTRLWARFSYGNLDCFYIREEE